MARGKKKESALTPEEKLVQALVPDWEWPYTVPKNWCWAHWGSCGEFIAGNGFKNEYQGFQNLPIPFYKVGSLKYSDSSGFLYDESNTIDEEIRDKLKATIIPVNSVIFAKIGEAIRLNRRSLNAVPCCIDNNLMAFVVSKACLFSYAYYWSIGLDLYDYTNATTVPAIRKSDLEIIPFPVAPLAEQQRIVDRIESLFVKLDEAKEKAQSVLDSFETRKAAILHNAFTGELTAKWRAAHEVKKDSWKYKPWGELICSIEAGKNWNAEGRPPQGDEFGVVKVSSVTWGEFDELESKTCVVPDQWNEKVQIKAGDFLFSRANTLQLVGNCVIVKTVARRLMLSDKILRFSFNDEVDPYYVLFYTRSKLYRQQAEQQASGNQDGMRNISQKNLRLIELPVPSLEEQTEIVRILDSLFAKEQQAKEAAEAVLEKIDLLKKSILSRAFRGELGTNDPTEESALELLKAVL